MIRRRPGSRQEIFTQGIRLRTELKIRDGLPTLPFRLPHYAALTLHFVKHLLRKKTFWILLAIFCAASLLPTALKLFGIRIPNRSISYLGNKPDIRYVANEGLAPAGFQHIVGSNRVRREDSRRRFVDVDIANQPGGSTRDSAGSASDLFAAIADSLRLWQNAFNDNDTTRYFSFYDSLRFRSPSGGYKEWSPRRLPRSNKCRACKHFTSTACG